MSNLQELVVVRKRQRTSNKESSRSKASKCYQKRVFHTYCLDHCLLLLLQEITASMSKHEPLFFFFWMVVGKVGSYGRKTLDLCKFRMFLGWACFPNWFDLNINVIYFLWRLINVNQNFNKNLRKLRKFSLDHALLSQSSLT